MGMIFIKNSKVWNRNGSYCINIPKKIAQGAMGLSEGDVLDLYYDDEAKSFVVVPKEGGDAVQTVPMVTTVERDGETLVVQRTDLVKDSNGSYSPRYYGKES